MQKILLFVLAIGWFGTVTGQIDMFAVGDNAYDKGDYETAYEILKPLAEQGDPRAQTQLGILMLNAKTGYLDGEAGVSWLEKAAQQNDVRALRNLGIFYTVGSKDGKVAKDLVKALEWSLRAAEAGDLPGQKNVAQTYAFGFGVPKNPEKAVYWYRKVAEQGDKSGQYNLGVAYFNGKGVAPDGKEARVWLEKAALQDDKDAALQLFHLHSNGQLLPQSNLRALCWMRVVRNELTPITCSGL